jgi:hypothetical protein
MPRNGSGTFSRTAGGFTGSATWQNQRDSTVNIYASNHDEHDQDLADAITSSLSKDGQTTPTANLPMGTYRHTGVGAPSARDQYATVAGIQDGAYVWCGTSTGSSNAYAVSAPITMASLVGGSRLNFFANHDNTGAATLNVNGIGAVPIRSAISSSVAISKGLIPSGAIIEVVYDSGNNVWRLVSPRSSAYTDYSPSYSASGSMTITSITTNVSRFAVGENGCTWELNFSATLGGTAHTYIYASQPVNCNLVGGFSTIHIVDIRNVANTWGRATPGATDITLALPAGANFTLGAVSVTFRINYACTQ